MRATIVASAFALQLLLPSVALACELDSDCHEGSTCQKPLKGFFGWCVGGSFPGNQNDRMPIRDPLDSTEKKGDTCQFDLGCGWGGKCVKAPGAQYGTCL